MLRRIPLLLCLLSVPAIAAPLHLSHQGRLFDAAGLPLSGSHTLTFRLYAASTGGTSFWQEGIAVDLDDGYFHATLGQLSAFDAEDFEGRSEVWLGLTVDSGAELGPRVPVVAVPYALHAVTAEGLVAGASVELGQLVVDGQTVVDADGRIPWSALRDVPPDTLAALSCVTDEVAVSRGASWRCEAENAHTHDGAAIASGTIAVGRLPVGSGAGTVAAGDHTHAGFLATSGGTLTGPLSGTTANFSGGLVAGSVSAGAGTFTGAVSVGALSGSSATFTGNVGAGSVTAGTATFTGAVGVGALTGTSATFSGAVSMGALTGTGATFSGTVDAGGVIADSATIVDLQAETVDAAEGAFGSLDADLLIAGDALFQTLDVDEMTVSEFSVLGTLRIGGSGATCVAAGELRYDAVASRLEVCDGVAWRPVKAARPVGDAASNPANSCKQVLARDPDATSGLYWIDGGGGFTARQLYCDMVTDGGGWTLTLKLNSSQGNVTSYFEQPTGHVTDALTTLAGAATGSDYSDGLSAAHRFAVWTSSGAREYRVTAMNASDQVVVDVKGDHTDPSNLMYHNAAGTPNPGTGYSNAAIPWLYRVLAKGTTNLTTGLTYGVVSHGHYACNCNESYRLDGDWTSGIAMWGDNLSTQPGRTNGAPIVQHTGFWVR